MADPHSTRSSKLPKATTLGSGLDQASPLLSSELPELYSIPKLIADESISVSDVNSILFVIDELSILDKACALMASLMPIWLATQLPANNCDCEYFHNGLTAICRFCDFPPAGYDPQPYTAVSPVPPRTILPPGSPQPVSSMIVTWTRTLTVALQLPQQSPWSCLPMPPPSTFRPQLLSQRERVR